MLEIHTPDGIWECDGCGKEHPRGTPSLTGITSCCHGGCYRSLCFDCVRLAYSLLPAKPDPAMKYVPGDHVVLRDGGPHHSKQAVVYRYCEHKHTQRLVGLQLPDSGVVYWAWEHDLSPAK